MMTGGRGGVKNCQNGGDVICGCPLSTYLFAFIINPFIIVSKETDLPKTHPYSPKMIFLVQVA